MDFFQPEKVSSFVPVLERLQEESRECEGCRRAGKSSPESVRAMFLDAELKHKSGCFDEAWHASGVAIKECDDDAILCELYVMRSFIGLKIKDFDIVDANLSLATRHHAGEHPAIVSHKFAALMMVDNSQDHLINSKIDGASYKKEASNLYPEIQKLLSSGENASIPRRLKKFPFEVEDQINAVEIQTKERRGTHIVAKKAFNNGDVILIDKTPFSCSDNSGIDGGYCYTCCKKVVTNFPDASQLISCSSCSVASFCSEICFLRGKESHQFECRRRHILHSMRYHQNFQYKDVLGLVIRIFFSNDIEWILSLTSCDERFNKEGAKSSFDLAVTMTNLLFMERHFPDTPSEWEGNCKLLYRLIRTIKNNAIGVDDNVDDRTNPPRAYGVYKTAVRLNHSCRPNAEVKFYSGYDDLSNMSCVLYVTRPIQPGEEICQSYGNVNIRTADRDVRREALLRNFGFLCKCDGCLADE